MIKIKTCLSLAAMFTAMACSSGTSKPATEALTTQPAPSSQPKAQAFEFDADSAYSYIAAQVAFGPRVPGSEASERCGDWIVGKLRSIGFKEVNEQRGNVTAWNGDKLNIRNISASLNPQAPRRILLIGHWDSRPWADQEEDPAAREIPIDGANDGASAIGVILEIGRQAAIARPDAGIDILFVDAEDYGHRADRADTDDAGTESWCLGSQYFVSQPTLPLQSVDYAILLDMVGGRGAMFPREYYSQRYASEINDLVWSTAAQLGYGDIFPDIVGAPIVDDHLPFLSCGIPSIDIIETCGEAGQGFNPTWHTHADNIDNIDRATLKAVGQTVLNTILK